MSDKLKNATFSLPENSIRDLKKVVEGGYTKSVNFAVREANTLGVLPSKDPMEGIEIKIKITKILKSCSKNS